MIVGRGMVATALKKLTGWEEDVLFSSGVSNSAENDVKAFDKEVALLKEHLQKIASGSILVYFSTTSIFDPAKKHSPYIAHKKNIENIIKMSGAGFMIIRLPNLVGKSTNPNTLTNYFAGCIKSEKNIGIDEYAVRHLIDVDDLCQIMNEIKSAYGKSNITVNVITDKPLTAEAILDLLEVVMLKKAHRHSIKSTVYENESQYSSGVIDYIWKTGEQYHLDLFKKYYSN